MYGKLLDSIGFVADFDPAIAEMMGNELTRQQDGLELIASENFASPAVIAAMGSILTNKYAEGCPANVTTVAVTSLTNWSSCVSTGPRNSSALNLPMCSPTPAPRPMRLFSWPCCSRVIH